MRRIAAWLALSIVAAACASSTVAPSRDGAVTPTPPEPTPTATALVEPPSSGKHSTRAAMARLCPEHDDPRPEPRNIPDDEIPGLSEVMRWVERARGLEFTGPVGSRLVTEDELDHILRGLSHGTPETREKQRLTSAWLQTIGAIPRGTNLQTVGETFLTDQVLAFYLPATRTLTLPSSGTQGPADIFALAHELVHALDDQHFDLFSLGRVGSGCNQDARSAMKALTEGNAMVAGTTAALANFSEEDLAELGRTLGRGTGDESDEIPSFIMRSEAWPYLAGQNFVSRVTSQAGVSSIDDVFRRPPASTEQIMHPDAYPDDVPQAVNVPDFGTVLGQGWGETTAIDVGEADIALLLAEQLDVADANDAAASWDGGTLRVWRKGDVEAIVMDIIFDTRDDAIEFAAAMDDYISESDIHAVVLAPDGMLVRTLFADDEGSLARLQQTGA